MIRAAPLPLLAGWLSPPLMLLLLAAGGSRACSEIPGYRGTLSEEAAVAGWTLQQASGGTCQCCGLCYQHPNCHSLSYHADTGQCRLFSQVASYSTFQRSFGDGPDAPRYYLMPHRSDRGQFCREPSDCTDPTLDCVAHICTENRTVTCRDVLQLNGTDLLDGFHWGAVQGRTLPLSCYQDGFTLLLTAARDVGGWTEQNWRNRSQPADPRFTFQHEAYSILGEAELIRDSGAEPDFQIIVYGSYAGGGADGGIHGLRMTLNRSTPLLATSPPDQSLIISSKPLDTDSPNPISGQHCMKMIFESCVAVKIDGKPTVPYHHGQDYLLTGNTQPRIEQTRWYWNYNYHDYGTLLRADGDIRWKFFTYQYNHRPDFVKYYIRE